MLFKFTVPEKEIAACRKPPAVPARALRLPLIARPSVSVLSDVVVRVIVKFLRK